VGGDEFVILMQDAGEDDARAVAEDILIALHRPFALDDTDLLLSGSIGISLAPRDGNNLATLQEYADKAMYQARAQRNQYAFFTPAADEREGRIQRLTRDIYHAAGRNELEVYFQPLVGFDEQLAGFEALMRWRHPEFGLVSPGDFIPIAEATGIILCLGEWILRKSCESCIEWQVPGRPRICVSVNASGTEFEQEDYASRLTRVLSETGLDPALLTIEITETALLRNVPLTLRHLEQIRKLGVEIALDDFGNGYSSLNYLQEINADRIKLDSSFVQRGFTHGLTLLESVVAMARQNGLKVTAEGVESEAQGLSLRALGCDTLQGYYYSKPMPADRVSLYMAFFNGQDPFAQPKSRDLVCIATQTGSRFGVNELLGELL
jgi:predicted signal transduction protein with EAL and GGDEF domain